MSDKLNLYVSVMQEIDKEVYHKMVSLYGKDRVHEVFSDCIYKMMETDEDMYEKQIKIWNKFGYYFALLDHNPFENEIISVFKKNSKNKQYRSNADLALLDCELFSLDEEVYYGFHLLKRNYINIFSSNDGISLDIGKIFSSIKSLKVRDQVLKKFNYLYDNCSRTSNFDNLFKNFLFNYQNLCNDGKNFSLDNLIKVDNCDILSEDELLEQIDMYVKYSIARDKFIKSNFRLVYDFSFKYVTDVISEDDLFQEGVIGLNRSIDTFDIRRGVKFSTYAYNGLKNKIFRFLANSSGDIRIPAGVNEIWTRYKKFQLKFYQEHGRDGSVSEIATLMGIDVDKLNNILLDVSFVECDSLQRVITINDHRQCDAVVLEDSVADHNIKFEEDIIFDKYFSELLEYIDSKLNEKEKDILFKHAGLYCDNAMTLKEIGKCYGVTRERIRQIEMKAIHKLTRTRDGQTFNPFL